MELSLQKLDREIKETRHERDKAVQELTRLKQHLLEKVPHPFKCSISLQYTRVLLHGKGYMFCVSQNLQ